MQNSDPSITELKQFINDTFRERNCARHLHFVDRERGLEDVLKTGKTFCDACGVILEFKESEDGEWEFWEKT